MTERRTDPERIDRIPLVALIIANLTPAVGVLFFDWDAHYLLLLYWMENLVVGGWTLVRMLHAGGLRVLPQAAFFSFHYSFFCAGHGIFILTLTDLPGEAPPDDFDDSFVLLMPFRLLIDQFEWIASAMPGLFGLPVLAFVISHGVSTLYHHFLDREDAGRDADDIMFDPYKRIVALHIAIILGAMAIIETGATTVAPALLLLVGSKIAIDVHQHRSAHRKRREPRRRTDRTQDSGDGTEADDGGE